MIKLRNLIRWGFVIIGIIILVAVFLRFKDFFLPVLAVIGGAIGYLFGKPKPKDPVPQVSREKEQQAIQQIDTIRQQASTTDQQQESLDQRIEDLEERVNQRRTGPSGAALTLLVGLFLLAGTIRAATRPPIYPPRL